MKFYSLYIVLLAIVAVFLLQIFYYPPKKQELSLLNKKISILHQKLYSENNKIITVPERSASYQVIAPFFYGDALNFIVNIFESLSLDLTEISPLDSSKVGSVNTYLFKLIFSSSENNLKNLFLKILWNPQLANIESIVLECSDKNTVSVELLLRVYAIKVPMIFENLNQTDFKWLGVIMNNDLYGVLRLPDGDLKITKPGCDLGNGFGKVLSLTNKRLIIRNQNKNIILEF